MYTVATCGLETPLALSLEGRTVDVVSIDERVEEEADRWEPELVFKMHYHVTLGDGRQLAIFRIMKIGDWYRQDGIRYEQRRI